MEIKTITRKYNCVCRKGHHRIDIDSKIWQYVSRMITDLGENITVIDQETKKAYTVPRIYIAIHGLKTEDLKTKGFRELI